MLVAVTCDRRVGADGDGPRVRPGRGEVWVSELTLDHLRAAGLTPVLLPPGGTEMDLVLGAVAGVVITGGAFDIHPAHYGDAVTARLDRVDQARTGLELALVRECRRRRKPLLGICGGMQALVVGLGGGLLQHVDGHEQDDDPALPGHALVCEPGWGWLGSAVNSTHHQAVDPARLGETAVVARAADGVVEAVVVPGLRMLGVEWHPELLNPPGSSPVFRHFAEQVRSGERAGLYDESLP